MEQQSHVPPIIQSSPSRDGGKRPPWRSVRWLSASRVCECCGKEFHPWSKRQADGSLTIQQETLWMRQRFCSISCSKIHSNCMQSPEVRRKVSRTMKARGHSPSIRGGNGQMTEHQKRLMDRLGAGWVAECSIPVANYKAQSLPKNLKIDVANPHLLIAIELDGHSHQSPTRRLQDSRKTVFLAQNGWFVFRITNQRADELSSTCKSPDTLLTSLMAFSLTTAISSPPRARGCTGSSWPRPKWSIHACGRSG